MCDEQAVLRSQSDVGLQLELWAGPNNSLLISWFLSFLAGKFVDNKLKHEHSLQHSIQFIIY
jgi:hypothetical protein